MKSLLLLILAATLFGCKERKQAAYLMSDSAAVSGAQAARRIGYDKNGRPPPVALSDVVVTGTADALPPVAAADISNMVIRTATVSIEVDSLEPAVARVRELTARFGGYVAGTDITTGKAQLRNATLEVRSPLRGSRRVFLDSRLSGSSSPSASRLRMWASNSWTSPPGWTTPGGSSGG